MSALVFVLGDDELAEELLAVVESRGGAVTGFPDVEGLFAAAARTPPQLIVVGSEVAAAAAFTIARRCEAAPALAHTRVVQVQTEAGTAPGGDYLVVPRRDCFATVGALLRFDPERRLAVQILARYEVAGDVHQQKRLGNVVELGVASLLFDADQGLPDAATLFVSFVVPGSSERLQLVGVLEPARRGANAREVRLEGLGAAARRSLRHFIEKRLVRTPAEVP